jgi:hypothetical protein
VPWEQWRTDATDVAHYKRVDFLSVRGQYGAMIFALLMVVAGAIYRLVPHPENVAPIAAVALIGGMYFGQRYALWLPLAILAVSDVALNLRSGYPAFYWPRVIDYAAFAGIGALGMWLRTRPTGAKLAGALTTPFVFFLVSNFGVWLFGLNLANEFYPKTLAGLAACYAAGLPFLRGTLIGDYAFMALFAGGAWLLAYSPMILTSTRLRRLPSNSP